MFRATFQRLFCLTIKPTPNPQCMKFESSMAEFLPEGMTCDVPSPHYKARHVLAGIIFDQYPEARAVFLANTYVTVTKFPNAHWDGKLEASLLSLLNQYTMVNPVVAPKVDGDGLVGDDDTRILPDDDEVVQCIKELLAGNVRPMVQADGGNIRFVTFDRDTGVLSLKMEGACASCPSSANTLQDGVERMLKHFLPEVKKVVEFKTKMREAPADAPPINTAAMPPIKPIKKWPMLPDNPQAQRIGNLGRVRASDLEDFEE